MKILFVNESTKISGGVDTVLNAEIKGLRENGFKVDLFEFSHNKFLSYKISQKIKSINLYLSEEKKIKNIKEKIDLFKPDVVHFHNTYPFLRKPLWSNDLFKEIKVVQHLHNYYPFCLNSFFYREEKICTECFDNNNFNSGIKNSCYDYSKLKTLLASYNRPIPSKWLEYSENVNLFLGVSQFVVDKYVEFGLNEEKIKKLYNGIDIKKRTDVVSTGSYALFLGNIVNSKGVTIVCELAERNRDIGFKIAGLGRDLTMLKEKYKHLSNLTFEGFVRGEKKSKLLNNCRFLLFPILSWESFGLVILEAMAFGKYVITSGLGGTSELVEDGVNGFIIKENDIKGYEKVVRNLWENLVPSTVNIGIQKKILSNFSYDKHTQNLIEYYESII